MPWTSRFAVLLTILTASCSDDRFAPGTFAERLCPTVTEWSDASVRTVNLFQEQSPTLSAEDRKVAYVESFVTLEALIFDWNAELLEIAFDVLDGGEVQRELFAAAAAAREEFEDGRAEAEALPIQAFEQIHVSNGSLFTGTEKAKAIVFAAIGRLWSERELVDDNCGRRPPVTINLEPG